MLDHGGVLVKDGIYPVSARSKGIRIVVDGSIAGIELAFVHHDGVLGGIQDGGFAPGVLHTVREVVVDHGLSLFTGLGGYQDNTVCGTGTVNGCGSGILQDVNALNVIGVDVVDAAGGHAVHNVKRAGMVDGADTTDNHRCTGTRGTGSLGYLHTGGHTLEHVVHTRLGLHFEVIGSYRRNRGRNHGFFLDTVADDHGLFQHLGVVRKDHHQTLLASIGNHLRLIADAGNLNGGTLRGGKGEVSAHARHGTVIGALLDYKRSDNGFAGGILDGTFHGNVLGHRRQNQS